MTPPRRQNSRTSRSRTTRRSANTSSRGFLSVILIVVAIIAAIKIFSSSCQNEASQKVPEEQSNLPAKTTQTFGDLLEVKTNKSVPGIEKDYNGFSLSFNPRLHIPNWVAWELTASEADGKLDRSDRFHPDPDVPGCSQLDDYRRSGYDRGHMAPAADMKWSTEAMDDCFTLTNILPQDSYVNSHPWNNLENKCRAWSRTMGPLYIVAGPVISDEPLARIGATGVAVPRRLFKVILAPYAHPARAIGFIMPNERFEGGFQPKAVSVDEVEAVTGYDFFSSLPDALETELEAQNNLNAWPKR